MVGPLGIRGVLETIERLVEFIVKNHLLLLLLTKVCLTIDNGIKHAEKVTLDQGHVAHHAFKAIDMA